MNVARACIDRELNAPFSSDRPGKKMQVCVKDEMGNIKNVHFGARGYRHNYSKKAWESYMARSAGIRDKSGNLTKNDKTSANYWARKVLWRNKWER